MGFAFATGTRLLNCASASCNHSKVVACGCKHELKKSFRSNFSIRCQGSRCSSTSACFGGSVERGSSISRPELRVKKPAQVQRLDPGDWRYSQEWWGSQGGEFGRGPGDTVFSTKSQHGNGVVSVTSHSSTAPESIQELQEVQQALQEVGSLHTVPSGGDDVAPRWRYLGQKWRVLRFNDTTRQSMSLVSVWGADGVGKIYRQRPDCLAFSYLKSMVVAGMSGAALAGLELDLDLEGAGDGRRTAARGVKDSEEEGQAGIRILCVGMGGGSLPLFLANALPDVTVDVVEIDPVVVASACDAMGFPPVATSDASWRLHQQRESAVAGVSALSSPSPRVSSGPPKAAPSLIKSVEAARALRRSASEAIWRDVLPRLRVHCKDAVKFVEEAVVGVSGSGSMIRNCYDLVFIDAYDGEDCIPLSLRERGGPFLSCLAKLLHPNWGTVVVNTHGDMAPPSLLARLTRKFPPGFHVGNPSGRQIDSLCQAYREDLLVSDDDGSLHGAAFSVATPSQANVSIIVARGDLAKQAARNLDTLRDALVKAGQYVANTLDLPFGQDKYNGVVERSTRGLRLFA